MPRAVKAWACEFRCGTNVHTSRKAVVRHEATCASNPERRACRTCEHQNLEWLDSLDPDSSKKYPEYTCNLGLVPAGRTLVFDCESHVLPRVSR